MRNYVRVYRTSMGLTLVELAKRSGSPVSTICEIEHGAEPRVMTAVLIARTLGASVEELWPVESESFGKPKFGLPNISLRG